LPREAQEAGGGVDARVAEAHAPVGGDRGVRVARARRRALRVHDGGGERGARAAAIPRDVPPLARARDAADRGGAAASSRRGAAQVGRSVADRLDAREERRGGGSVSADKNVLEPKARRDERAFLGEELLTWLWFRVERGDAEFDLGQGRRVGVALDAPLVLRAAREDDDGKRPEQVLRFGRPLGSPEAAAALGRGKRLARARLIVADGGREWEATFDAESFSLRSARVPNREEEDLDARGEE